MFLKKQRIEYDKRHKCSICGRVRYEKNMKMIIKPYNISYVKTRYGNYCWACVDNPDCQQRAGNFCVY